VRQASGKREKEFDLRPQRNKKKLSRFQNPVGFPALSVLFLSFFAFAACSFDYGSSLSGEEEMPDIIMNDVEYVRVRDGDPQVRFKAELAERYEESRIMELKNFSFEQFERRSREINAAGRAGEARVELDSGDINLAGGVTLAVESEDIVIETGRLDWKDEQRDLSGDYSDEVRINRANGTSFSGRGFSANARTRLWGFSGGIGGTYIHDDDEDEDEGDGAEEGAVDEDGADGNGEGEGESGGGGEEEPDYAGAPGEDALPGDVPAGDTPVTGAPGAGEK
jgi:LPS export ABC transporter protein LptC